MKDLLHWIWLSLACTPGNENFRKLIQRFGDAESIYNASDNQISACISSNSRDYNSLCDKEISTASSVLEFCRRKNVGILTYNDEKFPSSLRCISNPPVLLYYRGILPDFDNELCISVVGTRRISDYGRRNAFFVASDLAKAGALVVSGMAMGIDGIAMAAALSQSRPTVAVLGSGIDICYPMQHIRLAREIVKSGCIFTEYAPGTPPDGQNFPKRNRIISGLSEAVVVIEGREKSGAIITARHAKAQGRAVYALPGNVGNPNSEVTNLLIKNGAKPFTSADDIIRDYENRPGAKLNPFRLHELPSYDMKEVLSEYQIVAVAPGDEVFKAKPSRKPLVGEDEIKEHKSVLREDAEKRVFEFDKKLFNLYIKIPPTGSCTIESLVDGENSLRDVMKQLLKLEMACFVTMLPGESVKRNLNFK